MDGLSDLSMATQLVCSLQSVPCALAVEFGHLSNSFIPGRWKFCLVRRTQEEGKRAVGHIRFRVMAWSQAGPPFINYYHTETCFSRKVLSVHCCFPSIGKAPTSVDSPEPEMPSLCHHSAIRHVCIQAFHSH